MKTKSEDAITKAMADLKREVALNATEQCLMAIKKERKHYHKVITSETGQVIRDNATGIKWQLMNNKVSSLFRKRNLLDKIAERIYMIQWKIIDESYRES